MVDGARALVYDRPGMLAEGSALDLGALGMGLFGGLALFLFGMELLTDTLKSVAGRGMKGLLGRLTTNRLRALLAGGFVTAVIQSSSITTVLTVGFVSAGLMTMEQSIGIVLGANLGTTVTAQIIAFDVAHYALLIVALGFAVRFFPERETLQRYGTLLLGLGLVFFGMGVMKTAMSPLQSYEPFMETMQGLANPLLAVLFGAVFTGLVQSSAATAGLVIVLAGQGLITLETGIALVLGANIGTCVTALFASIGRPRVALQVTLVHILFNVLGVAIWFFFIGTLADWVRALSPVHADLVGPARIAAEAPRQIANAHTLFNAVNAFLFLGFTGPLARLVVRLVPAPAEVEARPLQPKYLDPVLLETPDLAEDRIRLELGRMGGLVLNMVRRAGPAAARGSRTHLLALARLDDDVDSLHAAVVGYCGGLSRQTLTARQTEMLGDSITIANQLEAIGDMIETNLVRVGIERVEAGVEMSEATEKVMGELHDKVCGAVQDAVTAVERADLDLARLVIERKPSINAAADRADHHLARRLVASESDRVVLFRLESEIIEYLKRVYYFAKRIAKALVTEDMAEPDAGPDTDSDADADAGPDPGAEN